MAALNYTRPELVENITVTETPNYGRNVDGYGAKIPTRYMLRYAGRNRRVYVVCYSNAGSAYVIVNGEHYYLDTDTEHAIMATN